MFPIASSGVLATGTDPATFTNIPQNFTHLQLRIFARSYTDATSNELMYIRPNSDFSTSNYRSHYLYGDGASTYSGDYGTGRNYLLFQWLSGSTSTANTFGSIIVDILDYSNTNKFKTFRSIGGYDANGSGLVSLSSGVWLSTSAITSLAVTTFVGQNAAGSRYDLYGITNSPATGA